ncbi:flavodoxin [Desulfovibrio sp.]|uniref:flavodoxin n=1 Tax=Desulfovibrio sp. TaxID=885 RepID=UPI0025C34544|nr:flavodoxin [Desulfovibrio sp.]
MSDTKNQSDGISRRQLLTVGAIGLAAAVAAPVLFSTGSAFAAAADGKRVLTVFHSRSGNTKSLATIIQGQLGGDLAEIAPATPYSPDYDTATVEARYQLITGKRPGNLPLSVNPASYDIICVGSPLWWGTLSVPVIAFLTETDLAGKTIVPFSTNGGGSRDKTFDDVKMICANSKVLDGFKIGGKRAAGARSDVASWLRDIGVAG